MLSSPPDPILAEPLRIAFTALRRHIYLEEQFLFPPIRAEGLTMPILVMLREHGTLWQQMELDQHNSKEEPIVYPHAETALAPKAAADLETFLRSGSMPEGWVCEGVR